MNGGDFNMSALRFPTRSKFVRAALPVAFSISAFALFGNYAQAAEPAQEVTITGTQVERIPYDFSVRHPVENVSVTARVPANLDVLTLNSGVALLKDDVRAAARQVCMMADPRANPTSDVTIDCIREAVRNAQPQIDALVARARTEENARLREAG
jgi:UrcA family protein